MENLGKKVGFLKGLMEGMAYETDSGNGKLMAGIVDLLGELADRVEAIDDLLEDLNDYVESIDDDLSDLEGDRDFDMDDLLNEESEDYDDDDLFPVGEDKLHLVPPAPAPEPEPEEDLLAGNLCPECNALFVASLKDPEGSEYICPHCGKRVHPIPLRPENAPLAKPVEDQ